MAITNALRIDIEEAQALQQSRRSSADFEDEVDLLTASAPRSRESLPWIEANTSICGIRHYKSSSNFQFEAWNTRKLWLLLVTLLGVFGSLLVIPRRVLYPTRYDSYGVHPPESYILGPRGRRVNLEKSGFVSKHDWTVSEEFFTDLNRKVISVNRQFPGPTIEVSQGDTLKVLIHNNMSIPTSIHWHGFMQLDNTQDGVSGLTQNAILPGAAHEYIIDVVNSPGTYWWHAHDTTRIDGLFGAVVVHSRRPATSKITDSEDFIEGTTDLVVLVCDWYEAIVRTFASDYLSPDNDHLNEPQPTAILINGIASKNGQLRANYSLPRIYGKKRSRYWNVRFINVGAVSSVLVIAPARAGTMTIVAADSEPVDNIDVPSFSMNVGQGYTIKIDTDDYAAPEEVKFEIELQRHVHRAEVDSQCSRPRSDVARTHRKLKADSIDSMQPIAFDVRQLHSHPQHTSAVHAAHRSHAPNLPKLHEIILGVQRHDNLTTSTMNGISYSLNTNSHTSHLKPAKSGLASVDVAEASMALSRLGTSSIVTHHRSAYSDELVILIGNDNFDNHPIHIHSHKLEVLAADDWFYTSSDTSLTTLENTSDKHSMGHQPHHCHEHESRRVSRAWDSSTLASLLSPSRGERPRLVRDTVTVNGYGWTLLRVRAAAQGLLDTQRPARSSVPLLAASGGTTTQQNAKLSTSTEVGMKTVQRGVWLVHCHNMWHEASGMAMLLHVL